jgi:hypothetical protein
MTTLAQSRDETPITLAALATARDACAALSPAQRIAFAIELVNQIDDPTTDFHLMRLGRFALAQSDAMRRARFIAQRVFDGHVGAGFDGGAA